METMANALLNEYKASVNACIEELRDKVGMLAKEMEKCEEEIRELKIKREIVERCVLYGFSTDVAECVMEEFNSLTPKQKKVFCEIFEKYGY